MIRVWTGFVLVLVLLGNLTGCAGLVVGGAAAGANIVHDRRTAGTFLEDQAIETKTSIAIQKHPELSSPKQAYINVTSYNNAVLLSGEVVKPELREEAENLVRNMDKVKYVHNELIVAPPSALSSRTTDTAITAAVKTTLLQINNIPDFDPLRVKVVTEKGTVYLFGLLTPAEAAAVTETVRRVKGVQQVVTLFEYID
jgi:osmotically-inducible protein OsmY